MIRSLLVLLVLSASVTPSMAGTVVCSAQGRADVILDLDGETMLGRRVSCIRGDFLVDLTPCAPAGAWGLSAPTGVAPLVKITRSRREAEAHLGGIARHWRTPTRIGFEGGFRGSGETSDAWSFVVDRRSGSASLETEGNPRATLSCSGPLR